jgi:hypothetical protein
MITIKKSHRLDKGSWKHANLALYLALPPRVILLLKHPLTKKKKKKEKKERKKRKTRG